MHFPAGETDCGVSVAKSCVHCCLATCAPRYTKSKWEGAVMQSLRIIVRRLGGPEVLETVEDEAPEPSRGEVRVRELSAGVSFADLLMREGIHPEKTALPFTPGWDIVGIVDKTGEEVPQAATGQIVAALPIHDGYA